MIKPLRYWWGMTDTQQSWKKSFSVVRDHFKTEHLAALQVTKGLTQAFSLLCSCAEIADDLLSKTIIMDSNTKRIYKQDMKTISEYINKVGPILEKNGLVASTTKPKSKKLITLHS